MDHVRRIADFRDRLERTGLDAYLLTSPLNVRYLCGFTGEDSTLLITRARSVLVTDSRYEEQAEREACVDEVMSRHTPMAQAVAGACKAFDVRRLGVTAANLTHAEYLAVAAAAGTVEVVSRPAGIAEQMRMRKDADEVEAIRASVRTAEAAFREVLKVVEPGRTERWLAARLEYEMRARGADGASFETICAAGAHASMPHAVSGEGQVKAHGSVLFDWGARLAGYCSDLTRVIYGDTIPRRSDALTKIVLEAQAAAFGKLKPGNRCGEADAAGRTVIAKAGHGAEFGHGIGHGVGLAVHEAPRLGPGDKTVLLPGMVVTVEPGVYLPGRAGVRIEEMAVITRDGCEVLTTLPRWPQELGASDRTPRGRDGGNLVAGQEARATRIGDQCAKPERHRHATRDARPSRLRLGPSSAASRLLAVPDPSTSPSPLLAATRPEAQRGSRGVLSEAPEGTGG
jgi:Xaa-Pro aminopeptidase